VTSLTIIIPVKNDARRLSRCLDAIARNRTEGAAAALIVADNGSTDDSPTVAAAAGARVLTLPGVPVSQLRNTAAAAASTDLLAFIDADHEIVGTWIGAALAAFAPDNVGAAGALYLIPQDATWVQRMYGVLRGRTSGRSEVAWLGSGNLVVRRSAFEQIGGFDPSLQACEDVDFCQRLRAADWKILGDEQLGSVHHGDPPTLAALFRAERWRGRDNLRVSLRGPLTLRELPSVLTPIVTLLALVAIVVSPVIRMWSGSSLIVAGTGVVAIAGLAALKAARMAFRARTLSPVFIVQAFAVALTYDIARAIALVTRAPHHRR
jgi:hypothetical protein